MSKVICVHGAPCSGKTTYVEEHAQDSDIIWDFDKVRSAITTLDNHSRTTDAQTRTIMKLRYAWTQEAKESEADTAWFICMRVTDAVKTLLGDEVEYKHIEATKEECLERLEKDVSRSDKEYMKELIEMYFEEERNDKTMKDSEIRAFDFEVRAEENEEFGSYITGRPIVYNEPTDMGWYREIIDDGALDDTDLRDVRFLVNHNTDMIPLARSRNNNANSTMQMEVVPNVGMNIRVNLDTEANSDAKSLYSAVKRGDISGMSFMFAVDEDKWEDLDSDYPTRHILSFAKVFEVSAVTFPAYAQTSIQARGLSDALDSARTSLDSAKAEAKKVDDQKKKIKLLCEI